MKKIVCCIDGRPPSQAAIRLATRLALLERCALIFLIANRVRPSGGSAFLPAWKPDELSEIIRIARNYAAAMGIADVAVEIREGDDVPSLLLSAIEAMGADMVVVGTGEPPFVGRLLLGSVSAALVSRARCSVLVARERADQPQSSGRNAVASEK